MGFWRALLTGFRPADHKEERDRTDACLQVLRSGSKTATEDTSHWATTRSKVLLLSLLRSQTLLQEDERRAAVAHLLRQSGSCDPADAARLLSAFTSSVLPAEAHATAAAAASVTSVVQTPVRASSAAPSALVSLTKDEIKRMKVAQLRTLLDQLSLASHGTKKELVDRVLEARDRLALARLRSSSTPKRPTATTPATTPATTTPGATTPARRRMQTPARTPSPRKPNDAVILVLDHRLQDLPWEALDVLADCGVTRMPSLALLLRTLDAQRTSVGRDRVAFVLNPAGDLTSTQKKLEPAFADQVARRGWRGMVNRAPSPDEMRCVCVWRFNAYRYCV